MPSRALSLRTRGDEVRPRGLWGGGRGVAGWLAGWLGGWAAGGRPASRPAGRPVASTMRKLGTCIMLIITTKKNNDHTSIIESQGPSWLTRTTRTQQDPEEFIRTHQIQQGSAGPTNNPPRKYPTNKSFLCFSMIAHGRSLFFKHV